MVECLDGLARITSEELATTHFVKGGILQNACSTKTRMVAVLGKSAHSHIVRLTHSRRNGPNRIMTEIHQKKIGPHYHRLKTMVKRSIEQNLRMKNFGARNGNFETSTVVKNQGTKQRAQRILGDCWQWESNGQCSKGDDCSFRHDINKRGKMTQSNTSPNSFMQQNERKASRTRSPRGKSPSGRMSRWPCKDYLKGTCNNSFCEKWHPPECLFYKTKSGCRFGEKCSYAHRQVDEQPTKRSKKNDDKSAVAMLKKNDWHENVREPVVNSTMLKVTMDQGDLIRNVITS